MSKIIQSAINRLIEGKNLNRSESKKVMKIIMRGEATEAQISAFLVALRMKGETVEEVTGAAQAMKDGATHIKSRFKNIVDTCGTGGDSLKPLLPLGPVLQWRNMAVNRSPVNVEARMF